MLSYSNTSQAEELILDSSFLKQKLISLKQQEFEGRAIFSAPNQSPYRLYFQTGRLIYATGGCQTIRCWLRHLLNICPHLVSPTKTLQTAVTDCPVEDAKVCWEYEVLQYWLIQKRISLAQAKAIVKESIVDSLFDIIQTQHASIEIEADCRLDDPFQSLDISSLISEVDLRWQNWETANLKHISPNLAPIIKQREALQSQTSEAVYQTLNKLLNGQQTFRDLGVQTKQNPIVIVQSLLPYINTGTIELIELRDLPITNIAKLESSAPIEPLGPLIACIDDSPLICKSMESILTKADYQVLSIMDPLRAISQLLRRKPKLIFLDLVMPNVNGYELCSQLRNLSQFQDIPIVILTGKNGWIDRTRAKLSGASDFLTKPAEAELVLATIHKHLKVEVAHATL